VLLGYLLVLLHSDHKFRLTVISKIYTGVVSDLRPFGYCHNI